jgi:hypothetical protein
MVMPDATAAALAIGAGRTLPLSGLSPDTSVIRRIGWQGHRPRSSAAVDGVAARRGVAWASLKDVRIRALSPSSALDSRYTA